MDTKEKLKKEYAELARKLATAEQRVRSSPLNGVYHNQDDKTLYATDGKMLLMTPVLYDQKLAGVVLSPDGLTTSEIKFPGVTSILATLNGFDHRFDAVKNPFKGVKAPAHKVKATITKVKPYGIGELSSAHARVTGQTITCIDYYYIALIERILGIAAVDLYVKTETSALLFAVNCDGTRIALMPYMFKREEAA